MCPLRAVWITPALAAIAGAALVLAAHAGAAHAATALYAGSGGHIRLSPPRVENGPVVDGRLDDPVWAEAAVLDSFTQGVPIEGVADSLGTQCLVLYDAKNLYIGFRCPDDPRHVQSPVTPRDGSWRGDYVCVNVDGFSDRQRSQFFCANACGVQMDGMDADEQDESDLAPDYLYASRGSRNGHGWEAEMAIPFTSLRFPARDSLTFGFNANREVKRQGANLYWAPVTRNINSFHAQMGTLYGLSRLRPGRNLQVNPAFTATRTGTRDEGDIRYEDDPRFGLGIKYGITSGVTADATLTPDFSQVEADADVVDVNERFAIYYPEKRPFFLEGSHLFATPIEAVYTRRIVDPRAGFKVTGKAGRTSVGLLGASDRSDGDAVATLPDTANPYRDHDGFGSVLRLKRDVLQNSYVGLLAVSREQLETYNRVVGVDGRINLLDRYTLTFQRLDSWTRGRDYRAGIAALTPVEQAAVDSALGAAAGRISRGDATTLELDLGSERLDAGLELVEISPDFAAELGFVPRTDQATLSAWLEPHLLARGPTWYTGFHPIVELEETFAYGTGWRPGRLTDKDWRTGLEVRFPRASYVGVGYHRVFTYFDGQEFPSQDRYELWGGSDRFVAARGTFFFRTGNNVLFDEGVAGRFWALELSADLRLNERTDASLSLNAEVDRRRADDTRYAEVVIPRLRVSYQFTRELSLRGIGQLDSERRFDTAGALASQTRTLALDALASFVLRPGTVAYLGYGSALEGPTPRSLTPGRTTAFLKLSYLWQG